MRSFFDDLYLSLIHIYMAGAFSEYVLVENPQWNVNLFKIPNHVSLDFAVLVEPLSVSMNGVMLALSLIHILYSSIR